jgi:hypothetical protein
MMSNRSDRGSYLSSGIDSLMQSMLSGLNNLRSHSKYLFSTDVSTIRAHLCSFPLQLRTATSNSARCETKKASLPNLLSGPRASSQPTLPTSRIRQDRSCSKNGAVLISREGRTKRPCTGNCSPISEGYESVALRPTGRSMRRKMRRRRTYRKETISDVKTRHVISRSFISRKAMRKKLPEIYRNWWKHTEHGQVIAIA